MFILPETADLQIQTNIKLASYTTLGIGGEADMFVEVNERKDFIDVLRKAKEQGWHTFILGKGSNVLFPDEGFRGLVIKNDCQNFKVEENNIWAESGILLTKLIDIAEEHSLSGIEQLIGIPGTLGGAIRGNAGIPDFEIKDCLEKATVFTEEGKLKEVDAGYFDFKYRESKIKHNEDVVIDATLTLKKGDIVGIQTKKSELLNERMKKPKGKSVGSFFKNPEGEKNAGMLIEEVGCKGLKVGDAVVSEEHANYLMNTGNASYKDFIELAAEVKRRVKEKFGIELEEEVEIVNSP